MTLDQAKALYRAAVESDLFHSDAEWANIHADMVAVVLANSDRGGGRAIDYWNCWDWRLTATKQARRIRQTWAKMKGNT